MNTIPNILFVIAIAVITGYLTFLTTKGGLTDNRRNGFLRKLTNRGRIVVCVLFSLLGILILQEINQKKLSRKQDELLLKERSQRDSIITKRIQLGIDSSNSKLFSSLSIAFAKQGLRLDFVNNQVEKITNTSELANSTALIVEYRKYKRLDEANFVYQLSFLDEQSIEFKLKNGTYHQMFSNFNTTLDEILDISFVIQNNKLRNEWIAVRKIINGFFYSIYSTPNEQIRNERKDIDFTKHVHERRKKISEMNIGIMEHRKKIEKIINDFYKKNSLIE
jgi:hypothetical protein